MQVRHWLSSIRNILSGGVGRRTRRANPSAKPRVRDEAVAAELLEDRTLLTMNAAVFDNVLAIELSGDESVVVTVFANQVKVNNLNPDTGPVAAVDVHGIRVFGSSGRNVIDLSAIQPSDFPNLSFVVVDGGQGDDSIVGSKFADSILAGHGHDTIIGGLGDDTINGGDGNDFIDAGDDDNSVLGRDGDDTILAGTGDDTIDGGDGEDFIDVSAGENSILGGDGGDTILTGDGNDFINGQFGEDSIVAGDGENTVFGGADADTLIGGADGDKLNGQGGDDFINGAEGDDTLAGGTHHDFILGGTGNDLIRGDDGSNVLWHGNDTINGSAGADTIDGDGGNDSLLGGFDNDLIRAGQGDDFALGGSGDDTIAGQGGNDSLFGGGGADSIDGGSGHDLVASAFPEPDPNAITISINDVTVDPEGDPATGITFPPAVSIPNVGDPRDIALGDFNGDGSIDIAATDTAAGRVIVLFNDGMGGFASPISLTAGAGTYGVVAFDFDGDGDLDLAATNQADNTVSFFRNNGAGTFVALGLRAVGMSPRGIAAADIDGDGDSDLLVVNSGSATVSVLTNNGNGSFNSPVSIPAGLGANDLVTGDFNNDGAVDLAVANRLANTVSVILGNGNGTFLPPINLPVAAGPTAITAADFDMDGNLDLATSNSTAGTVSVLIGSGTGAFSPAFGVPTGGQPSNIAAGDFDSDGDADLVVTDQTGDVITVLINDGNGAFGQSLSFPTGGGPVALAVGQVDGDGDLDIVTANPGSADLSVLLNGSAMAAFVVTLSAPSDQIITVDATTLDGTAIAGQDYEETTGTIIFAPGQTQQVFFVPIIGDLEVEFTENFFVVLSDPVNAEIGDGIGEATIIDDDTPDLSINDVTVFEGNAGATQATFTVSLSAPSVFPVTVDIATSDDTTLGANSARAGSDYLPLGGTLTFPPGVTSQTFTVTVIGDTILEGDETFLVTLSNATNAAITDAVGVGTILEDGDTTIGVEILDASVTEGDVGTTNMVFVVEMTAAIGAADVTFDIDTADITATDTVDYTGIAGVMGTITAGTTTTMITVPIIGDLIDEIDETFSVTLSNLMLVAPPMGTPVPVFLDAVAVGTIVDDDGLAPNLVQHLASATFSSTTFTPAVIGITPDNNVNNLIAALTAGGGAGLTVTNATLQGHTIGTGVSSSGVYTIDTIPDTYGLFRGGIVLSSGDVTDYETGPNNDTGLTTAYGVPATVAQELLLDQITGGTFEHFDVTQLTIEFDMQPGADTIFFDIVFGSEEFPEFVGSEFVDGFGLFVNGTNIASVNGFPVNIDHPDMAAIPGTELDGVLAPGGVPRLQFSAFVGDGTTGNTLTIIIADTEDPILDSTVYISSLSGRVVEASIDDVTVVEGDSGITDAVFTVTLSEPSTEMVMIDYATADGSAIAGEDYMAVSGTLFFPPGTTSQTVLVPVLGDEVVEMDETFFLNLTNPLFVNLDDTQGIGLILDDDTPLDAIGDTLLGGIGNDTLLGAEGDDFINGEQGDDLIDAGEGNDTALGGAGQDTINGGEGNDCLRGGSGSDAVFGDAGQDTIVWEAGDGTETVDGGRGFDQFRMVTDSTNDRFLIDEFEGRVRIEHRFPSAALFPHYPVLITQAVEDIAIFSDGGADRVEVLDLTRAADVQMLTIDLGNGRDLLDATAQLDPGVRMLVFAGNGDDTVLGGAGRDIIDGGNGNDSLEGGAGNDVIDGNLGVDRIRGGAGNDLLRGGDGRDFIWGDAGDDTIEGGLRNDELFGGGGDDNIDGGEGHDSILAEAGNDSVTGGAGDDTVDGGIGADTIHGQEGNDSLQGGDGDDYLLGGLGGDTLLGGAGHDSLVGGDGMFMTMRTTPDGDDFLNGNAGRDTLRGEEGNDTLLGGSGADDLDGGVDNDQLNGNGGDDTMRGGDGDDRMWGGGGDDTLNGGHGNDTLHGQAGNDGLAGDDGNDILNGGGGADTLHGGDGDDTLRGGADADLLIGHDGSDDLDGQGGSFDTLVGGDSFDILEDNGGTDIIDNDFEFFADWIDAA